MNRTAAGSATRPNLLFIMSDDHAAHAISAYSAASGTLLSKRVSLRTA